MLVRIGNQLFDDGIWGDNLKNEKEKECNGAGQVKDNKRKEKKI